MSQRDVNRYLDEMAFDEVVFRTINARRFAEVNAELMKPVEERYSDFGWHKGAKKRQRDPYCRPDSVYTIVTLPSLLLRINRTK